MKIKTGGMADAGIAIIVGLLIGLVAAQLVNPTQKPANAQQTAPFDHSQCQYPYRTTNPPNGCDNSDPCDPAQTKGGSGDCLPQPTTVEPTPTVTPAQPPKAAQCGGK